MTKYFNMSEHEMNRMFALQMIEQNYNRYEQCPSETQQCYIWGLVNMACLSGLITSSEMDEWVAKIRSEAIVKRMVK